ncbi:MAG: MYXO-CTERM sorting domain-containing protein, partial [Polyangiales bacterium]
SGRLRSHDPGCGCRTVTSSPHPGSLASVGMLLLLAAIRRRRR